MPKQVIQIYIVHNKRLSTDHAIYDITTISNLDRLKSYRIVQRRYNDFYKLHCRISPKINPLPHFPSKTVWKASLYVIERRVKMFNIYMSYLCNLMCEDAGVWDAEIVKFLNDDVYE